MNQIIPSTKFRVLTVHKMSDMTCLRKFFWSRIMNLEPAKINWNFWFGGVLHAGFEALLLGRDVRESMVSESRKRSRRHKLSPDDIQEMKLQFEIIYEIVTGASRQHLRQQHPGRKVDIEVLGDKHFERFFQDRNIKQSFCIDDMSLDWAERQIKFPLRKRRCLFCATIDGFGEYKGERSLYEIKTARTVDNNYFTTLEFDTQVCAYVLAHRKQRKEGTSRCCYCVFRKPQKRIKKGQSPEQFVAEIRQDIKDRPDWYYIAHPLRIGQSMLAETEKDIEATADVIQERMLQRDLLNPDKWPRQTRQCLSYGVCPFLILCKYPHKWKLYLQLFKQREMLYEEEKEELQK